MLFIYTYLLIPSVLKLRVLPRCPDCQAKSFAKQCSGRSSTLELVFFPVPVRFLTGGGGPEDHLRLISF